MILLYWLQSYVQYPDPHFLAFPSFQFDSINNMVQTHRQHVSFILLRRLQMLVVLNWLYLSSRVMLPGIPICLISCWITNTVVSSVTESLGVANLSEVCLLSLLLTWEGSRLLPENAPLLPWDAIIPTNNGGCLRGNCFELTLSI